MKVRYFEKRGQTWADFTLNGDRKRVPTGAAWGNQKAAEAAMPAIIARLMQEQQGGTTPRAAAAEVPQARTVASGHTLSSAYKLAMKTRESWMQAKDKGTLQTTFDSIVASHKDLSEDTDMAYFTRDNVRTLRATWMAEAGKRKGTTLSPSTINHRLSMLSVLLEACDLPPHTVKHLSTKGNERTRRITDVEVRKGQSWLLAHSGISGAMDFADLITVALDLGCRQGELLGVPHANIDLQARLIRFDDTKNGTSRTLPLPEASLRVLERRTAGAGPFSMLTTDRCTALWNQMKEGIGLQDDDQFVFHSLRHEALSRLGDKGTNALTLKAIAGHANVTTTQRYVHSSVTAMADAMGAKVGAGQATVH